MDIIIVLLIIFTGISTYIYYKYDLINKDKIKNINLHLLLVFLANGLLIFTPYLSKLFDVFNLNVNFSFLLLFILMGLLLITVFGSFFHKQKFVKKIYLLPSKDMIFIKLIYIVFYLPIIIFDIYRDDLSFVRILLILTLVAIIFGFFIISIVYKQYIGRVINISGRIIVLVFCAVLTLYTSSFSINQGTSYQNVVSKIYELDKDYTSQNVVSGNVELRCDKILDYAIFDNKLFVGFSENHILRTIIQIQVFDLQDGSLLKSDIINTDTTLYSLNFEINNNKLYYMDNIGTFIWKTNNFDKISDLNALDSKLFLGNNGHLNIAESVNDSFIQIWDISDESVSQIAALDYTSINTKNTIYTAMGDLIVKSTENNEFIDYNTNNVYELNNLPEGNYIPVGVIEGSLVILNLSNDTYLYIIDISGDFTKTRSSNNYLKMNKYENQYYSEAQKTVYYQNSNIFKTKLEPIYSFRSVYLNSLVINYSNSIYMLKNYNDNYYYLIVNINSDATSYFELNKLVSSESKAFSGLSAASSIIIFLMIVVPLVDFKKPKN